MKNQLLQRIVRSGLPLVALAACSSTEPLVDAKPDPLPLEGRWIVTTVLDTFRFETGYNPPTCNYMYCGNARPDTSGRLSVSMTFAGDSLGGGGVRQYRLAGDTVSGVFQGMPYPPTLYPSAIVTPSGGVEVPKGAVTIFLTDTLQRKGVTLTGTYAGDSIVGRVYWTTSFGRSPPSYTGSFMARRQH